MKFEGTLDSTSATSCATRMKTFFNAWSAWLPTRINISWDGLAQVFSDDQRLTGEVSYTPPSSLTGGDAAAYAAPVGMVVNWLTSSFSGGRRDRGRTFLVPLCSDAFFTDGTPTTAVLGSITTAAQNLRAGTPAMVIAGGNAQKGFHVATVTGVSVPDRAAVLRSRRD